MGFRNLVFLGFHNLHMAVNDVAGEWVYPAWDILQKFMGHFVSGLPKLKHKKPLTTKKTLKPKMFY